MLLNFAISFITTIFQVAEGNRHYSLQPPNYYNDEGRSFTTPTASIRYYPQRLARNGLYHPSHLRIPIIDSLTSKISTRSERKLDPSAIIFEENDRPAPRSPPHRGLHSDHHKSPSKTWNPHLLVATVGHPSDSRVLISNVTSTLNKDWFNITTDPNTFYFDVRGSCMCWLIESFVAINCLTNETLTTDTPKELRTPINPLRPYFRISYASTHVYFSGPGPQDLSLLSIRSGRYLTFTTPDPGPEANKGDIFVIDTLRNLLLWLDYIYFRIIVQPLHQLQSKLVKKIELGNHGANTKPTMTLDEERAVLYMFVNLNLLRVNYLEDLVKVEELYKLNNVWNEVIFNFMYFKDNLLWATWSVPRKGKNVTNLWMVPTSASEPPTGTLKGRSKNVVPRSMLGFRAYAQETEGFHEPSSMMSPEQSDFVFLRDPWVLNLPSMNKTDAFLISCPGGSQLVRISNGTDFCADGPAGMSWTMIVGYIVAPLVILIPALIYLVYLLTTMCKRRRQRYST